jgi:hypothetical protein
MVPGPFHLRTHSKPFSNSGTNSEDSLSFAAICVATRKPVGAEILELNLPEKLLAETQEDEVRQNYVAMYASLWLEFRCSNTLHTMMDKEKCILMVFLPIHHYYE